MGERVRCEGDELVQVGRRDHTDRPDPAQLASVLSGFLGLVHPDTHELEPGVTDDLGDHHLPHEPCPPYDDSLRHSIPSVLLRLSPESLLP